MEDTLPMMMMMMMMMMAMVIQQVSSGGVKSVKGSQPSSEPQGAPRRSLSAVDPFTNFAPLEDTYEIGPSCPRFTATDYAGHLYLYIYI